MEEFGNIDIEGRSLAFSSKDLEKLSTPDGCSMKLVTERVYNLEEGSYSDDEDQGFDEDIPSYNSTSPNSKYDRMKKEYLSLVLNANRDPIKPGIECKLNNLFADDNDNEEEDKEESIYDNGALHRMQKRYKRMANYEEIINNKTNGYEEVSPGRVYKRRLSPGVGQTVTDDSIVIYNCDFWTENSTEPFDSTWLRRNTIITDLSNDSIIPGLHELLLTTKKSEFCEAFIRPEAAFGPLGAMPRIPPNATIFCLLEVVKVVRKDKMAMFDCNPTGAQQGGATFDDFYNASDTARMRGNYFYEQKQFKAALQRYKSGIRILEALTYKDENEEKKAMLLMVKLYNNWAKAANALNEPRLALAACKQASMIDDMDPKTHWNRMVAWKKKGHLDRALGVARRAMQLFPTSMEQKPFQREANELKKRIQIEKADLDELHRLMGRALSVTDSS